MDIKEFDKAVFEKASSIGGHCGHAARSSVRHLERAWSLRNEMPEVAVFLAITAQEEAATALLLSLKKRKYENSKRINIRNHVHKTGVYPIIQLMRSAFLSDDFEIDITLYFDNEQEGSPLRFYIPMPSREDAKFCIIPDPPLNIHSQEKEGLPKDYHAAIDNIASKAGIESIRDHLGKLANERNQMLYASGSDIPNAKDADSRLNYFTTAVIRTLIFFLLIEPYERQNLVQEALNAFIKALDRVPPNIE